MAEPSAELECIRYRSLGGDPARAQQADTLMEQCAVSTLKVMQEIRSMLADHPTLQVHKIGADGRKELLKSEPVGTGAPLPEPGVGDGIDRAGYAFVLTEATPKAWGVVYVFCRAAQAAFFHDWAMAFARQGLEVRQYVVDQMYSRGGLDLTDLPCLPEDVLQFAMARHDLREERVDREARAVYEATRLVLDAADPKPLAAFMWGHSEHWHRAPALACKHAGIPTLHVEGAMFPRQSHFQHGTKLDGGHVIINRGGQYYEDCRDIDELWAEVGSTKLTPAQASRIDTYVECWRECKASKYGQANQDVKLDHEGRQVLFVPLQVDRDASLFYADKAVGSAVELLDFVAEATSARDWHIVAKIHPHFARPEVLRSCEARHGHLTVVSGMNIHDLLGMADAVCGINSTVLLEACCYDKPVIALGSSCYTGKGFTFDVRDEKGLEKLLRWDRAPLRFTPDMRRAFRRFLHMMMWEGNGGNGFFIDRDSFDAARLVGG